MRCVRLWPAVTLLLAGVWMFHAAAANAQTWDDRRPAPRGARPQDTDDHVRHHGRLGILMGTADNGVTIVGVIPGSPAEAAGLRAGDLIRSVGGEPVHSTKELTEEIRAGRPGAPIDLTIRRGGQRRVVRVTLDADDQAPRHQANRPAGGNDRAPALNGSRGGNANTQQIRILQQQISQLQQQLNRLNRQQSSNDSWQAAEEDTQRPDWGWDGMDDKGRDPDILQ